MKTPFRFCKEDSFYITRDNDGTAEDCRSLLNTIIFEFYKDEQLTENFRQISKTNRSPREIANFIKVILDFMSDYALVTMDLSEEEIKIEFAAGFNSYDCYIPFNTSKRMIAAAYDKFTIDILFTDSFEDFEKQQFIENLKIALKENCNQYLNVATNLEETVLDEFAIEEEIA